jgi:hypothetical protein
MSDPKVQLVKEASASDSLMAQIEALAEKFEELEERVRLVEINQDRSEGYAIEDYGPADPYGEEFTNG